MMWDYSEDDDPELELLKELIEEELCPGDKYQIFTLDQERVKNYDKASPVIVFDEEVEDFVWLLPPKHLRN